MTDKQIKVLMIEDNPGDIRLIREMFKEVDISLFDLETASCLKEGLEKIEETLYNVILLDLGLPDNRGLETFIKVSAQKQEIPIIVLTGLADETVALDAIKRGAQDYLVKEQLNTSRLATSISYAIERKKTERRLVKSEQWFRMLIETSPEVVTATDMEGRITYVSPRTLELHGFKSPEELIGENALELISPEDHERAKKNLQITLKDGILKNAQYTLVKKDGTRFIGELSSALVCGIEGELKGFVAITRDITERKRTEEALQKRNAQLELIHHIQSEIPVNTDIETVLVRAAESIGKSFGYYKISVNLYHPETEEIEYLTGWNKSGLLIPRGHRQKLGQGLIGKAGLLKQTIVANDVSKEPDYISYHLTETKAEMIIPLVVQDRLIGVLDLQAPQVNAFSEDDVSVLQAIASYIAHIIDEKKQREELGKEKDKAQKYLDIAGVMIVFLDPSAKVNLVNKKGCEILGYPEYEIIGKNWFEAFLPARIKDEVQDVIKRLMAGEVEPVEYHENPVLTKQGEERIIAWHNISLKDEAGNFVGVLCSGEDITERRRAEEMLRERESKLNALFEILPIGVSILDAEKKISFANSALERILEISREGLFREDYKNRTYLRPDGTAMPAEEYASVRAIKEQRAIHNVETGVVKEDGTVIWTSVSAVPIKLADWKVVIVTADITERRRAEEELKKSEERFRLVFESAPDAYYMNDLKGNFINGNKAAEKLTGYKKEELVGMSFLKLSLLSAEYIPKAAYLLFKNLRGKSTGPDEFILKRKDGSKVTAEISTHPVKLEGKTVVLGIARDITERKNAEQSLKENEMKYRALFECANDAVFLLSSEGKHVMVNKRAADMLGYRIKELIGLSFRDIVAPSEHKDATNKLQAVWKGESFSTYERIFRKKNGAEFPVEITIALISDAEGKPLFIQSVVRDITERKRAEEALQESEEKYRTLVENAAEAILIAQDGMLKFVNRMASEIIGYSEQELRSSPFLEFVHPDDRQMVGERYLRRLKGDVSLPRYAFRLINKDGSIKWVEIDAVLVAWEDKPATLNFLSDITERKRAEEELGKHREHLEELVKERTKELEKAKIVADAANRAKSVFLANMSHEIRTPMNAILGFSQLMQRDETLTPVQWQHLDTINRSGEHLMALINDILEMSKIEAGRATLNPKMFDLRTLLEDLEMMFRVRTDAKKLNFAVEGLGHIPNYVVGDQGKLRQVFINLLGNAVKFTEKGGVVLRIWVKQEDSDRLRLLAEVEDTGPGIPETELNNLFKPFQQTQNGRQAGSGTGLGLAISKEFVRLMGGDVTVNSQVGKGSLFKFKVQLRTSESGSVEKKPEFHRVMSLRPGQPTYRILIADDEGTNLVLSSRMLGNIGFETRQVTNGKEAVEEFTAWLPHLILMDMRMPMMDGYEAIRRIRAGAGGRDVKIISVSASAFSQNRLEALEAGADDFIAKPFREAVLFEMIGKLLGVEYVFSEEARSEKLLPSAAVMSAMTAEVLSALPEESVNKMRDAVTNADFDLMMELVGGVEDHNILVAQELRSLIERFEYTELLELLQTGRNAR